MTTVLVTAASQHGATGEIAQAIAGVLTERGLDAVLAEPDAVGGAGGAGGVDRYDAVVLGSAVYSGRWLEPARALVERSAPALAERPVWLFSSGPVGDPSHRLVQRMGADPVDVPGICRATRAREHRVFAGKLDRAKLPLAQRVALSAFPGAAGDFRDWTAISSWACGIADALAPDAAAPPAADPPAPPRPR